MPKKKKSEPEIINIDGAYQICPSSLAIWLALKRLEYRKSNASFNVSYQQLYELSGINRPQTINRGLNFLIMAGWLKKTNWFYRKNGKIQRGLKVTLLIDPVAF